MPNTKSPQCVSIKKRKCNTCPKGIQPTASKATTSSSGYNKLYTPNEHIMDSGDTNKSVIIYTTVLIRTANVLSVP